MTDIKTLNKIGHHAEEILNTAKTETVDIVAAGSRGKRFEPLMIGSVIGSGKDFALTTNK